MNAARDLLLEHGAGGLTSEDLAERADVARRTLFNHFASLEEVVVTCLETELEAAITTLESAAPRSTATGALEELRSSFSGDDVLSALVRITRMSRGPGSEERQGRLQQQAMRRLAAPVARQLRERHGELSALDAALLTTTVLNGVSVIAMVWVTETGGVADSAGRRRWAALFDHLFTTLRRGFAASVTPSTEGA